jgi:hypothetical protein
MIAYWYGQAVGVYCTDGIRFYPDAPTEAVYALSRLICFGEHNA